MKCIVRSPVPLVMLILSLIATTSGSYAIDEPPTSTEMEYKTAPASTIGVRFRITAQATYGFGVPVTIRYRLQNSSSVAVPYESYNAPLPISFIVRDEKNRALPLSPDEPREVYTVAPSLFEPNTNLEGQIDLKRLFRLPPGRYVVVGRLAVEQTEDNPWEISNAVVVTVQ